MHIYGYLSFLVKNARYKVSARPSEGTFERARRRTDGKVLGLAKKQNVSARSPTSHGSCHALSLIVSIMMMVDRIGVIRMPWLRVVLAIDAPHSCTKSYSSVCMVRKKS
jgi:hypothetical protein